MNYSRCIGSCRAKAQPVDGNLYVDVGPSLALNHYSGFATYGVVGARGSIHGRLYVGPFVLGIQLVGRVGAALSGTDGLVAMWMMGPTVGLDFGRF